MTNAEDLPWQAASAYTQANRAIWNTWTARDGASQHHQDVARYRATGSSLRGIELALNQTVFLDLRVIS